MAFFSFSLTFTIKVNTLSLTAAESPRSHGLSKPKPCQHSDNTPPHHLTTQLHTVSSDARTSSLSYSTQQLQHRIRAKMHAHLEADADAESLERLQAAEARKLRLKRARERTLDRESLWILERETAKLERKVRVERWAIGTLELSQKPEQGSAWSFSRSSSFEKIELTGGQAGDRESGPSAMLGLPACAVLQEQQVEDPFASPSQGRETDFVQSLIESHRRREEGGVFRDEDNAYSEDAKANVADLMRWFEDLEARDRVGMEEES